MKTDELHMLQLQSHVDHLIHIVHADTEFVFGQSGSDIGMGMRTYIGIDAESYIGNFTFGGSQLVDDFQLRHRLDIETENIVIESQVDFPISLTDSGKNDLPGRETGLDGSADFTSADTIGTQSTFADDGQYLRIGIGLDGIVYTEIVVTCHLTVDARQRVAKHFRIIIIERSRQLAKFMNGEYSFHFEKLLISFEFDLPQSHTESHRESFFSSSSYYIIKRLKLCETLCHSVVNLIRFLFAVEQHVAERL